MDRGAWDALLFMVLGAIRAGVCSCSEETDPLGAEILPSSGDVVGLWPNDLRPVFVNEFTGLSACAGFDNDPSAGSPTETLLRLLLPLNDKVQWTSRDVAGSEPPTSPRSEHFTGPFNR